MAVKSYGAAAAAPQDLVTKAELDAAIAGVSGGSGMPGAVSSTAPVSPATNYLWVDTSEPGVLELTDFGTGNPTAPTGALKAWARTRAGRRMLAMMGPSGLDTSLQPLLATNRVRLISPNLGNVTPSNIGMPITAVGTATAVSSITPATTATAASLHLATKRLDYLVTAAANNAIAGWRSNALECYVSSAAGMGGFFYVQRFSPATGSAAGASRRTFVGLTSSTAAPTDVDPSTLTNNVGVGYSSADTNWVFYTSGTATGKTATSITKPAGATDRPGMYELAMFCAPGSLVINMQFTDLFTGQIATLATTPGTQSPASGTGLAARGWHSVGGVSSVVGFTLFGAYLETDF